MRKVKQEGSAIILHELPYDLLVAVAIVEGLEERLAELVNII